MNLVQVPVGSRGFDCTTKLTAGSAASLKGTGMTFAVRYLGGLSAPEMVNILDSGLGLELVTYSKAPGWLPTATLGASEGVQDVAALHGLGIPKGMLVWIDLEGSGGTAMNTAAWAEARAAEIAKAGYLAGLYVGDSCVLDGAQLYALAEVTRYWSAFNYGIPEPACGFCQYQLNPPDMMLQGVEIDMDVVQEDFKGRLPMMLVA